MKFTFAALAAFALLALPAGAQMPTFGANSAGWTGIKCPAASATNLNWVIDVSKQASVGVMLSAQGNTNGVLIGNFAYVRSVDGVTYESAASTVSVTAPTDYTTSNVLTNLPSYGAQFIKFLYFTNTTGPTGTFTNIAASYGTKISSP